MAALAIAAGEKNIFLPEIINFWVPLRLHSGSDSTLILAYCIGIGTLQKHCSAIGFCQNLFKLIFRNYFTRTTFLRPDKYAKQGCCYFNALAQ